MVHNKTCVFCKSLLDFEYQASNQMKFPFNQYDIAHCIYCEPMVIVHLEQRAAFNQYFPADCMEPYKLYYYIMLDEKKYKIHYHLDDQRLTIYQTTKLEVYANASVSTASSLFSLPPSTYYHNKYMEHEFKVYETKLHFNINPKNAHRKIPMLLNFQ